MDVIVLEASRSTDSVFRFGCDCGEFIAKWCSNSAPPSDRPVDVEFTIVDAVDWANLKQSHRRPGFYLDAQGNHVVGLIESFDFDGVMTLRVGTDVILLESYGTAPAQILGLTVELVGADLEVYPEDE